MDTVFLNGDFMPMSQARISPMDRGFLFGDGIYEVVPSYDGRLVGWGPHMDRMQSGLDAVEIDVRIDHEEWRATAQELITRNGGGNLAVYFHVSRGADTRRDHAYPTGLAPTIYAFAYEIPPAPVANIKKTKPYSVITAEDLRWRRCNIKSTALLGNVMHMQDSHSQGHSETILYNSDQEITEAAACNVYVVKDGVVATPDLDYQKLPGITRYMLLAILRMDGSIRVEERVVTLDELRKADEVWLSSSSKDIAPVVEVDGQPVNQGKIGPVWLKAQTLYTKNKFEF
ncbi:MAG: aminotransferase class IV [Halioglobus sp.]